ncbi:hypothetical protein E2C01_068527 [Portunus trituberculatus]|uniref:Uncharacterized protein n=1 Tax=Portunus trituberculatus TaxID=210409 RepID=A0A5B7HY43_PORTR|nr:hypothetical protein [Portunus trituberculatus]
MVRAQHEAVTSPADLTADPGVPYLWGQDSALSTFSPIIFKFLTQVLKASLKRCRPLISFILMLSSPQTPLIKC